MLQSHRYRKTARVAKLLLPSAAGILSSGPAQSGLWLTEVAAAMLRGKGAGSGWDPAGEITAALRFISPGSTVLDVGANLGDWSRARSAKS